MMYKARLRLSTFDGLVQRPEGEAHRQSAIQRPNHCLAREPIEDHRQVNKFRLQPNVGDVCYPKLIDRGQFHPRRYV